MEHMKDLSFVDHRTCDFTSTAQQWLYDPTLMVLKLASDMTQCLDFFGFATALRVAQTTVAKSGDYAKEKYGLEGAIWPPPNMPASPTGWRSALCSTLVSTPASPYLLVDSGASSTLGRPESGYLGCGGLPRCSGCAQGCVEAA